MKNSLASLTSDSSLSVFCVILGLALLLALVAWFRGRQAMLLQMREKEALKSDLQERGQELALCSQELAQSCSQIENLDSTILGLQAELRGVEGQVVDLREANAKLTGAEQSLREAKERVELDFQEAKAGAEEGKMTIEALNKTLSAEREEMGALKARLETRVEGLLEKERTREEELATAEGKAAKQEERIETLREELERHDKEAEVNENRLANEQEKLAELKEQFGKQKEALMGEFQVLSESILKERQKELGKTSREGIQALLAPLKQEIGGFKKRVETVHSESIDGQGQMKEQLKRLREMNSQLTERAENLTNALRNDKKTLGNWGEIQVERLLENAGLDKNTYRREANFKTDEGANQRPDFIIDLPEEKCLIVDSKVSLNAYVDSVNAGSEEERLAHLKQHTTNIRNHIKGLAGKGYDSLGELNSPDFIFMFMPIESAYLAAFEEDASLFDFAYEKQVAVVTPNTLLPILKTVQSLWRIDRQNKSTEALAESAGKIHKKLMTFLEKFLDVEKKIDSLQSSFTGAKGVLTSGRGNLIRLAEDFEEKGVKVSKAIPAALKRLEGE